MILISGGDKALSPPPIFFLGELFACIFLGELGQIEGVTGSLAFPARLLASLAEYRVGYGEYVSYPAPWSGAPGVRRDVGEGGGGVDAMMKISGSMNSKQRFCPAPKG